MPAKSEAQRRLFGAARGVQKGTTKPSKVSGAARKIARTVPAHKVREFAGKSEESVTPLGQITR